MDLQTMFDNAMAAARAEELKSSAQLTLGEVILLLKSMPQDAPIRLDTGQTPGQLDSWRGIYRELAFDYDDPPTDRTATVAEVLADAESAVGKTFEGYKGGDFLMGRQTPVWVSQYGTSVGPREGSTAVVGIKQDGGIVVIETAIERD